MPELNQHQISALLRLQDNPDFKVMQQILAEAEAFEYGVLENGEHPPAIYRAQGKVAALKMPADLIQVALETYQHKRK